LAFGDRKSCFQRQYPFRKLATTLSASAAINVFLTARFL
jgi:hypothetical protein